VAKLPRYTATTPPPRESGMARATDIGALTQSSRSAELRGLSQIGQAIGGIGETIYKIDQQKKEIDRQTQFDTATKEGKEFMFQLEKDLPDMTFDSLDQVDAYSKDVTQAFNKFMDSRIATAKDEKLRSALKVHKEEAGFAAKVWAYRSARDKWLGNSLAKTEESIESFAAEGNIEEANKKIEFALSHGMADERWADRQRDIVQKVYNEAVKDGIKVSYQAVIDAGGSKQDAYKVIDAAYKDKMIDADTREILGNNLDGYVRGRVEQARAAEKLTARQEYEQLIPQLFDPEMAQSRYDNVDKSRMSPKDKIKWFGDPEEGTKGYIAGTYEAAPIENTPKGHSESAATVFDAMSLQISPQEAYDELLTSRFIDKSITDEQFNWAIDKINNPYPQPVADALRTQLKVNLKTGWFDDEVDRDVNERLIAFVDDLVKKDKVPDFDLDKKLYAQSQKYRWGRNSGFEIGDVIDIDGTDWEVVGFDKSGEPLMEPVK